MKRVVVVAKGDVQRVGYRDEVARAARKLEITGFVENLKPYDVKIVAEGDEERLKRFVEDINIRKFPIFVERLDITWEDATGEFKYFEVRRGEWQEELFERLDAAGRLLYRSVELGERSVELGEKNLELGKASLQLLEKNVELSERSVKLSERAVELGEKSIKLGEKGVELSERSVKLGEKAVELGEKNIEFGGRSVALGERMLDAIREESEKTRAVVREESGKLRRELKLLRSDVRVYFEENLREIRVKVSEIEKALRKAGIM